MKEQTKDLLTPSELSIQLLTPKSYADCSYKSYLPSEGFTSRYDPQGQYIAIGCNSGLKILFSTKQQKTIAQTVSETQSPVTSIKWRPMHNTKTKVLGVGDADGNFQYWHVPSMKKLFSIKQKQNSIHCVDFSSTGEHFATAGRDMQIRVYDQSKFMFITAIDTKSISTVFESAQWNYRGHSNRIFSVKFIDQNTLVSGGWDSVIHVWDTRVGKSVRSFYGPHVAGDSLDYKNGELLIGCYAAKDQIQIWDFAKFQQKQAITWTSIQDKDKVAYVYTCCFNPKNSNTILAGACGINEVKVFGRQGQNSNFRQSLRLYGLKSGVYSIDHSWKKNEFCFSTSKEGFYIYDYTK